MGFRILIVDDEPIIRRGLCETIPWEENQIQVAGAASDGKEAIQKLQEDPHINLIITDIKMPNMDGLELASFLHHSSSPVRMVIISGYEEFAYAQQALQLGVKNYLLKPVDVDELLSVVIKIKEQTEEETSEANKMQKNQLKNAIYQRVRKLQEDEEHPLFQHIRLQPFITMVRHTRLEEKEQADSEFKKKWKEAVERQLTEAGTTAISLFTEENVLFTCFINEEYDPEKIIELMKETESVLGSCFYTVIYKNKTRLPFIQDGHEQMLRFITDQPASETNTLIFSDSPAQTVRTLPYPNHIEGKLSNAVFQMEKQSYEEAINELFTYFENECFSLREAAQVCRILVEKLVGQYEALFHKTPDTSGLFFKADIDLLIYNTMPLMKILLEQDTKQMVNQLEMRKSKNKDWLINRAEEYIQTYAAFDIKAQEVADYINISPNYFSSLFKQATGRTFNEYVNALRIEEAKTLLAETPFKVNEIAAQVGYKEYKYFVEVFKKICGVTPTVYRKMLPEKR